MQNRTKKNNKKTKKGGLNLSGCPQGKVRAFGIQCGIFRSPLGCCIDNNEQKLKKVDSFIGKFFGGKRTRKIKYQKQKKIKYQKLKK